ncbi:hypothetical protein G6734_02785 [Polynucleobacter paneuropaeus]|nr:hypothetical protein [Polynucleobacter paneuropaeus]
MTKKHNLSKQFKQLMAFSITCDQASVEGLYGELEGHGIGFEIYNEDKVEFKTDGGEYTQLTQHSRLRLGGEVVYEWKSVYFGYYGGMGAGWFVEEDDTTLNLDVETMLRTCGIKLETPDVPRPSVDDEGEDG